MRYINVQITDKVVLSSPHAVTEEYGRPVGANPLLPSDYSRSGTPADRFRAIKRRIKTQVSAQKFFLFYEPHLQSPYALREGRRMS